MSIGKNSIARAVNATAKAPTATNATTATKLNIQSIGLLSVAKIPDDTAALKQSISKRGVLCPVLAAATPKGELWLLDGYSRLFAAKELGITELNATVISVENKSEANRIYNELSKLKPVAKRDDIHQEKFRVLCVKDHDLPTYLL